MDGAKTNKSLSQSVQSGSHIATNESATICWIAFSAS